MEIFVSNKYKNGKVVFNQWNGTGFMVIQILFESYLSSYIIDIADFLPLSLLICILR